MFQWNPDPQATCPILLISLKVSSSTSIFSEGVNVVFNCCRVSIALKVDLLSKMNINIFLNRHFGLPYS